MKRLIFILGLFGLVSLSSLGQTQIVIPGSQFPVITNVSPWLRIILVDTNGAQGGDANHRSNATVRFDDMVKAAAGTGSLSNIVVLVTNIVYTGAAVGDGFDMAPTLNTVGSNMYWWDWGQTNASGQNLMYAELAATNDVVFNGATNLVKWRPFSYMVEASNTTVRLWFPTNLTLFNTNGMYPSNKWYVLFLTNGNVFRHTMQSNKILEHQWITKGQ